MTTITYRETGRRPASLPSGGSVFAQFSARVRRYAERWQRWRDEQAIESIPFEMRKDFGWPTADIAERRKGMQ